MRRTTRAEGADAVLVDPQPGCALLERLGEALRGRLLLELEASVADRVAELAVGDVDQRAGRVVVPREVVLDHPCERGDVRRVGELLGVVDDDPGAADVEAATQAAVPQQGEPGGELVAEHQVELDLVLVHVQGACELESGLVERRDHEVLGPAGTSYLVVGLAAPAHLGVRLDLASGVAVLAHLALDGNVEELRIGKRAQVVVSWGRPDLRTGTVAHRRIPRLVDVLQLLHQTAPTVSRDRSPAWGNSSTRRTRTGPGSPR